MTHAIVPLAIAAAAGPTRIPARVALAGAGLAMLPDADVIGFALGIEYADPWGHRGASHSLVFAALTAAGIALVWKRARKAWAFAFLALAMASHGLLDTLTDGGLGAALWWPFDNARIFAPVTPVRVSPIGAGFFSARGLETMLSEIKWIWLPCALLALGGWALRSRRAADQSASRRTKV
ncbi:metal-dependent hydrolase [Aurantiacibacter sp. MUD61]|uniref:metal-dependent hydrolase n=1 Tax=Aurantiacibacter sp. MUD61 TaxID=3009083 RepID=UPI0022F102F2|nr:metal-dependent hydrolase [Aurantiacibacter sp. MUD61]